MVGFVTRSVLALPMPPPSWIPARRQAISARQAIAGHGPLPQRDTVAGVVGTADGIPAAARRAGARRPNRRSRRGDGDARR